MCVSPVQLTWLSDGNIGRVLRSARCVCVTGSVDVAVGW